MHIHVTITWHVKTIIVLWYSTKCKQKIKMFRNYVIIMSEFFSPLFLIACCNRIFLFININFFINYFLLTLIQEEIQFNICPLTIEDLSVFTFCLPRMVEKVLLSGRFSEMEILMDLHVKRSPESKNYIFSLFSMCMCVSVCVSLLPA